MTSAAVPFRLCALTNLILLFLLLVGDAPAAERVTIATPSRGLFEFPVVVAMRKGFYRDEGIDVDKVQMQPALGVKALISGDVDYLLAWGSALRAAVTGVPVKAVVGIAATPTRAGSVRPRPATARCSSPGRAGRPFRPAMRRRRSRWPP